MQGKKKKRKRKEGDKTSLRIVRVPHGPPGRGDLQRMGTLPASEGKGRMFLKTLGSVHQKALRLHLATGPTPCSAFV